MIECLESCSSSPSLSSSTRFLLYPRREPFEHGLLPISKLIFSDPFQSLAPIKQKLLEHSTESTRVSSSAIADVLQIPIDNARLVTDTLDSVIHTDSDPISSANPDGVDAFGANVNDLILFLYIQSYKRLLPRTHKDSAAVVDVWPSTSAFDGCLSALSPLQLVRSNSRRFMPSQSDEEAHQLSYLQKHLTNILSLLAESCEGGGEESLVLSMERFGHLGFLVQFFEKGSSQSITLNQAAPFFANSDPDMPAVPVSANHVHDWLLNSITYALECMSEKSSAKENGPSNSSDQDVPMLDVCSTSFKSCTSRNPCFVEGISKSSYVKQAADFKGASVKVINCHDSVIYVLAPLKYAIVYGCSDATIVLGAVGKAVKVEHCERVHVITAAKRICIANCRECVFFLGVNHRPLVIGDNHKLQVAPYNTFYSQLEEHMKEVGVDTSNRWDEPLALSAVDPHDSLSHPAGISDSPAESATRLEPDHFINFLIPKWLGGGKSEESMEGNPFQLPDAYVASQQRNYLSLGEIKEIMRVTPLEDSRKRELSSALHLCFKDWLYASGNIRQLYYLQGE